LILEEALVSGGRKLRDEELGGIARVEAQAEGGFTSINLSVRNAKQ